MEAVRAAAMQISMDELQAEQQEIESAFRNLRFAQKLRLTSMSCFKGCGGELKYPFTVDQDSLYGKKHHCFGDCMNVNLE